MPWSVPEAAPLAKRLLRVAGRVVIDTGQPDSSSEAWPNTEWIDEALWELGYQVRALPERGRREKREVRTGVKARGSQALN